MMIGKHRGILTGVTAAVLAMACAATLVQLTLFRLPPPEEATSSQLMRWLVLRELEDEPIETSVALVDRFQYGSFDRSQANAPFQLPQKYRDRVARNLTWLQRAWFVERTRQYHELEAEQRAPFLVDQLEAINRWQGWARVGSESHGATLASSQQGTPAEVQEAVSKLFERIARWMHESSPEQRAKMGRAVADCVVVWLATEDLGLLGESVRREVAGRIVAYYADRPAAAPSAPTTAPAQMHSWPPLNDVQLLRLRANAQLLLASHLAGLAEAYEGLPPEERGEFIEQQIVLVMKLPVQPVMGGPGETAEVRLSADGADPWQLLEQVIAQAPADSQSSIRRLVIDAQRRVLQDQLRRLWPSRTIDS